MKFSKEFLIEDIDNEDSTIYDRIVDHSRWSTVHERVFVTDMGHYYITSYSVGATEYQDETPYQDCGDEIECKEVFPVKKTVLVYE